MLTSDAEQWQPADLVGLLALLVLGCDILVAGRQALPDRRLVPGLVLAMALLGPAPAARSASPARSSDALRRRVRGTYLLNNLATYATFPLLGGARARVARSTAARRPAGGYARRRLRRLHRRQRPELPDDRRPHALLRGGSLREMFRTVFLPVLPWELAIGRR